MYCSREYFKTSRLIQQYEKSTPYITINIHTIIDQCPSSIRQDTLHSFPIEDLKQTVEMAKGILTKETIHKQQAGQSIYTPFMNIKDSTDSNIKPVLLFNNQNVFNSKVDKLIAMMSRLTTQSNN